jgi:hypothetical protein
MGAHLDEVDVPGAPARRYRTCDPRCMIRLCLQKRALGCRASAGSGATGALLTAPERLPAGDRLWKRPSKTEDPLMRRGALRGTKKQPMDLGAYWIAGRRSRGRIPSRIFLNPLSHEQQQATTHSRGKGYPRTFLLYHRASASAKTPPL